MRLTQACGHELILCHLPPTSCPGTSTLNKHTALAAAAYPLPAVARALLQVVHTLTGHTNAVSCVSCSPLDEGLAVSAGEDRCLKVSSQHLM